MSRLLLVCGQFGRQTAAAGAANAGPWVWVHAWLAETSTGCREWWQACFRLVVAVFQRSLSVCQCIAFIGAQCTPRSGLLLPPYTRVYALHRRNQLR